MSDCKHNTEHNAKVSVAFLEDVGLFSVSVTLECKCGRPFQFIGLPLGLNLKGATMSVDGQEARLAAAPVGAIPQPLDGALMGFRVRMPGDH